MVVQNIGADFGGEGIAAGSRDALFYHGGDLAAARVAFPNAPEPWIDLSTGVGPLAFPIGDLDPDCWRRLPSAADLCTLEAAAARAYGVADVRCVVAAPGAQALISRLPAIVSAKRVAVLGYTYAEHGRAWARSGASVATVDDFANFDDSDVAILVNPNNPDGRLLPAPELEGAAQRLAARGGALVVDESFIDFLAPSASFAPRAADCEAIVLRSFGKAYGLPGLRLGFAVAPYALAQKIRDALGPWPVSGPAIAIGRAAYADRNWLAKTRARLAADAARLDALLAGAGLVILGGTPLFRLACVNGAKAHFVRLAENGVLVRPFAEKPTWLRFGLPRTEAQWELLEKRFLAA